MNPDLPTKGRLELVPTRAGRVAVAVTGEGPPLFLLHSTGHSRRDFDAVAPALARSFRTYAVDWPGHGDSDMPSPPSSTRAALMCDALEDVVDALRLPPAVFVGNSVGGTAAIRIAGRRPDRARALVLVDSGGLVEQGALTRAFCWVQGREIVRRATGLGFAGFYMKRRNEHVHAVLARLREARARPGFIEMDAAMWRHFAEPSSDVSDEARAVRCPTLIVWGRRDPTLRAGVEGKRARELVAHAEYVELDTGHVPFVEDPPAFLDAVLPFLRALPVAADARDPEARA